MSVKLYSQDDIWDAIDNYAAIHHGIGLKEDILKKPCIYADLPDGMDGKLYHIEKNETSVYYCDTSENFIDYTCEVSDISNNGGDKSLDWILKSSNPKVDDILEKINTLSNMEEFSFIKDLPPEDIWKFAFAVCFILL